MDKIYKICKLILVLIIGQNSFSQELYVGANAEFYLKKDLSFTTSNTVVTQDALGKFSLESGTNWGSTQEYVNGNVWAYGSGTTLLPTGNNGVYAPVSANHTGQITAAYLNAAPTTGANGTDVTAVSDVEYWELTGNAVITLPWNTASNITDLVNDNGGDLDAVAVVGYDSGTWNLVSASQTNSVTGDLLNGTVTTDAANEVVLNNFAQFTFGIDNQVVLSVDDLFLSNELTILSNPVSEGDNINFSFQNDLDDLEVFMYSLTGRQLRHYKNIGTLNGIGSLPKPNVSSGIYFLKFLHNGKQGVKKIIIQ
tara:strand:+ start:70492 stop:71421 length:930 start_codon:yes stop_codon:yes gene_type:complete